MRRLGILAALARARSGGARPAAEAWRSRLERLQRDDLEFDDTGRAGAGDAGYTPPPEVAVDRDLAYGTHARHTLDVYRRPGVAGAPVMLIVHGGGWRRGDKGAPRLVRNKVEHWAGQGWVVVSANYRLVPDASPVEQAGDVSRALAFVQAHAAAWGGDAGRIALTGHSAGAHLVSLLSADASLAADHGAQPWRASVAIDSAAFDVPAIMAREHFGLYDIAFGDDTALWHRASPLHRLNGRPVAPMLLVCSARRPDACQAAQAFAAKANRLGGQAAVLALALSHFELNETLGLPGEYTESVDGFLGDAGLPAAT
jgi:arylformamidase